MPLRIELEDLWRRLATRFKARTAGEEDEPYPVILDTVQPVTSFDDLAREGKNITETYEVTGTGWASVYTVPQGKRLELRRLHIYQAGGDYTFTGCRHMDVSETVSMRLFADIGAATDHYADVNPEQVMEQGDVIQVNFNAGTAPGDYAILIHVIEEDAY